MKILKIIPVFLILILACSIVPATEAALVVNKYTNDFTLSSPTNEQLKVCSCETKTDLLIIENVGNFHARYNVEILSPVGEWMTLSENEFDLAPKHRKELINYIETPCGEIGTYDYTVRVTSSYGRVEYLTRTIRADQCQNVVLTVVPLEVTTNLCQPVRYDISVKNVGTYGETYQLDFGSYDEYMNVTNKEFYLKPGQVYAQEGILTLPCTFYGEYEIPFVAFSSKNRIEDEKIAHLNVENQFDHSVEVDTQQQLCSRVKQQIPVTIANEIDVANEFNILLDGPRFVDVQNHERTITLEGNETRTLILEADPQEGEEGMYLLDILVESKYGNIEKQREIELDVKNCYDFEIEMRNTENTKLEADTLCCGMREYYLNIHNRGQTQETYNVVSNGPSWFVPEELTVRLDPAESKNVRIYANAPCADETYVIPVTVVNNRFTEVNETMHFTINSQTERTCHYVGIDDDEFRMQKDDTIIPLIVKHNGSEGGVYSINITSDLFSIQEKELTIWPGESKVLHLIAAENVSTYDFGRYISQPIFTYKPADNPLATVSEDIEYVEHIGTQLRDKNIFVKFIEWLRYGVNWGAPGVCGWIGIILLILVIIAIVMITVFANAVRPTIDRGALDIVRVILLGLVILIFVALALIKLPDPATLYEQPENPGDYFVTIYENGRETIDLDAYFIDPDMDVLSYVATQPKDIAVYIENHEMTLIPDRGFAGENEIVITARDERGGVEDSPILKIYVVPKKNVGFLGLWHRYCVQINLALLLLAVLLLLVATFLVNEKKTKTKKQVFVVVPKHGTYEVAKKVKKATRKTARKIVKKAAAKKTQSDHSKAMDRALVSKEDHEMKHILGVYKKRQTQKNIKKLRTALKQFKKTKSTNNRENFYKYLASSGTLAKLDNLKSVKKTAKVAKSVSKLDRALVSEEDHEMKYVLDVHGKRSTQRNVKILRAALQDFKASQYKTKNRETFYRYLKEKNILRRLHNKK